MRRVVAPWHEQHVRVPLGQYGGAHSPLTPPTEISLLDISLEGREFRRRCRGDRAQEADHRRRHQRCVLGLSSAQPGTRGFEVQVVADAGGSPSKMGDDMALRRMVRGGVTLTGTNQLVAELVRNWTAPEGSQMVQVAMETMQA